MARRINLRVEDALYERVAILARIKGTSMQDVVATLLAEAAAREFEGGRVQQAARQHIEAIKRQAGLFDD